MEFTMRHEAKPEQAIKFHYPPIGISGVTIGYGWDLKGKNAGKIREVCGTVGISDNNIEILIEASKQLIPETIKAFLKSIGTSKYLRSRLRPFSR